MNKSIQKSLGVVLSILVSLGGCASNEEQSSFNSHPTDKPSDPLSNFLQEMFQMNEGKTLCSTDDLKLNEKRTLVITLLQARGMMNSATNEEIASAAWTLFPCPFSPYRSELKPIKEADIHGIWLFAESYQPLRYGRNRKLTKEAVPIKCEAVSYYANSELRNAQFGGAKPCPFKRASDLDYARKLPKVSSWQLVRPGRIAVNRTDVTNHIEEWDTYVVTASFQINEFKFEKGELVQYLRRTQKNKFNASSQFRHLKRLPE